MDTTGTLELSIETTWIEDGSLDFFEAMDLQASEGVDLTAWWALTLALAVLSVETGEELTPARVQWEASRVVIENLPEWAKDGTNGWRVVVVVPDVDENAELVMTVPDAELDQFVPTAEEHDRMPLP